ncbi:MAG: hypothetical protein EZS28_041760 [Streblomastix strix]|uniref:Uncharacterized protein n=1 Tax=Streblomastix strix TaxID=222440 RepID=A0A5J4TXS6_9EUKA|nr:MAG: hypothetical protein EZS28_041760 [Streblomastix strix]
MPPQLQAVVNEPASQNKGGLVQEMIQSSELQNMLQTKAQQMIRNGIKMQYPRIPQNPTAQTEQTSSPIENPSQEIEDNIGNSDVESILLK